MAAARYWRVNGIRAYGDGDLQISEMHLHDASGRVDAPALLTCSHAPVNGSLSDLRDAATATMCRFAAADVRSSGFWLQWDFGDGVEHAIEAVDLGTGTSKNACPEALTVLRSSDGAGWTTTLTIAGVLYPGQQSMVFLRPPDAGDVIWTDLGPNASTWGEGYLGWTCAGFLGSSARAGRSVQSGRWYWELAVTALNANPNGNALNFGVWPVSRSIGTYIYNTSGVYRAYQACAAGDVFRFAFDADAGTLAVYRNAVLVGGVSGQPLPMSEPWAPVIGDDNLGGALVTANFGGSTFVYAPPEGFLALVSGSGVGARPVQTARSRFPVAASAPMPAFSTVRLMASSARDTEFGGPGTIYGTTTTKGTPNTHTKARVVLLHQRSKLPVRETWSDPVTGAFAFTGIDTAQQFITLAEDAAGNFRPVAANRLTPEETP